MAQDYIDILQPFDHIIDVLEDNQAILGLRYIAQNEEELLPQFPALLVQTDATERELHATQQFMVRFHLDLWVFHNDLTVGKAVRSRQDIQLATDIRKLLHSDRTLGGHIIHSFIDGEFPGISARVINNAVSTMVTTRMTWMGTNRVRFQDS